MKEKHFTAVILGILATAAIIIMILDYTGAFFSIKGKWKNVGDDTFGQIQKNSVLVVGEDYCNLYSPRDTYAFTSSLGGHKLEITSFLFGEQLVFDVTILDDDNIILERNSTSLRLKRVD